MLTADRLAALYSQHRDWLTHHLTDGCGNVSRTMTRLHLSDEDARQVHMYARGMITAARACGGEDVSPAGNIHHDEAEQTPAATIQGAPASPIPDPPPRIEHGETGLVVRPGYVYNPDTDTYIFRLPGEADSYPASRAWVDWLCGMYSELGPGGAKTINQIAKRAGIHRRVVIKILAALEQTHDAEPFGRETILREPVAELAASVEQEKRLALFQELQARDWSATVKDAQQWRQLEHTVLPVIEGWIREYSGAAREVSRLDISSSSEPYLLVMGDHDVHYGLRSWSEETGAEEYNRQVARDRWLELTVRVIRRALAYGAPERIVVPVGSDFYQSEADGETTKGTRISLDGTWAEHWVSGADLFVERLDMLRRVAPVELVFVPGNHAHRAEVCLMKALLLMYRECADVSTRSTWASRNYVTYGNTILAFEHGDTAKPKAVASAMAAERPVEWGLAVFRYAIVGHLHHRLVESYPGATAYQLASLSGRSRYEADNALLSQPGYDALLVSEDRGINTVLSEPATV